MRSEGRAKPERAASSAAQACDRIRYALYTHSTAQCVEIHLLSGRKRSESRRHYGIVTAIKYQTARVIFSEKARERRCHRLHVWLCDPYCPAAQIQLFNTGTGGRVAGQPVSAAAERGARRRSASRRSTVPLWSKKKKQTIASATRYRPPGALETLVQSRLGTRAQKVKPPDTRYDEGWCLRPTPKGGWGRGYLMIQQSQASVRPLTMEDKRHRNQKRFGVALQLRQSSRNKRVPVPLG